MTRYEADGIYVGDKKVADWPPWEQTCPRCGRYHRRFTDVSGDAWNCTYCHWIGNFIDGDRRNPIREGGTPE